MALVFPVALDDFFAGLKIREAVFWLPSSLEMDRTAGGEVLTADHGARLWEGRVTLVSARPSVQGAVDAKISVLHQAGRAFYVFPRQYAYPAADPNGEGLGVAVPVISGLFSDGRSVAIGGLPPGYVLTPGDFLAFDYGSAPTRRALHRVVIGAVANSGGLVSSIEVTPEIRPGALVGAPVILRRPSCKAVLLPGSVSSGVQSVGGVVSGASFSFVQTLR